MPAINNTLVCLRRLCCLLERRYIEVNVLGFSASTSTRTPVILASMAIVIKEQSRLGEVTNFMSGPSESYATVMHPASLNNTTRMARKRGSSFKNPANEVSAQMGTLDDSGDPFGKIRHTPSTSITPNPTSAGKYACDITTRRRPSSSTVIPHPFLRIGVKITSILPDARGEDGCATASAAPSFCSLGCKSQFPPRQNRRGCFLRGCTTISSD